MYELVIYDTSNYEDFPIGGQLTSVRNFLTYIAEYQKDYCSKILLVGLTTSVTNLGKKKIVDIGGKQFDFLPVVYRNTNLKEVKNSLRLEFLKGLFKYKDKIPHEKEILHYIHTPEAFIQVKLCHPFARTAIFSHGSFFNMVRGFRFFQNNKIVGSCFEVFIKWMLRNANLIFVLDDDSLNQYINYNKNVVKVNNSIILPEEDYSDKQLHNPIRLLFVGRLSKVKRIDEIIKAVENCKEDVVLTIVGDGEERTHLESLVETNRVKFTGALKPDQVKNEMIRGDILVMNSVLEGEPMTIIEAMSYGMPIITTNVGGISELVEFGGNAIETDGTFLQIICAIKNITSQYTEKVALSLCRARDYDFKLVNAKVFSELRRIKR